MNLLSFYTINAIDVTDGSCEITWRSDVNSVSHAILPGAVCFATSRLSNHAICSYIDSNEYASGPIRKCLFIDYIIKVFIFNHLAKFCPVCSVFDFRLGKPCCKLLSGHKLYKAFYSNGTVKS